MSKVKEKKRRISGRTEIINLVNRYGLPLKLTRSFYFGNFYFLAERHNKETHEIEGTQYRNEKVYGFSSYTYEKLFIKYDSDEEEPEKEPDDREYNHSIRDRIQKKDSFDEVEANHDELLNHQKAGLLLASRYDKFAFFYDTGTGKTVMTLSIMKKKQVEEDARFLILAPKAIIKTAWMEDAAAFFPDLRILPLSNNFYIEDCKELYERWKKNAPIPKEYRIYKRDWDAACRKIDYKLPGADKLDEKKRRAQEKIRERMSHIADHYIVNIEKFRYDPDAFMREYDVNGLVIDESAVLKNPNSKSAKTVSENAEYFDYIYLLSGKPAPNNSTEYYSQMKLVDPDTFSMSFEQFKKTYFSGSGSNIVPASAKAEDDVANMIARRSLIVSKEDCLELPEMYRELRPFKLPYSIMAQYDRLYQFCMFALQEKEVKYSCTSRLPVFTKLREIASGFLIDDYGDVNKLHDLKIKELIRIVEKHPDEQIVVWCQFEYEIRQIVKALSKYGKVVTAYGRTKNIDSSISQFKSGEAKYIVAHPKSIKYGVTFVNCNLAVYYSMSFSAEDYYQSRDRIHRMGQKRICTYYFLQAENTIDEIMYDAVDQKMSYAEVFSMIVKQAAKHGVDYQEFKDLKSLPIRNDWKSAQKVREKYDFEILDGDLFRYRYKKRTYEALLFNTLLKYSLELRPEEILFEVGFAIRMQELEKKAEKQREELSVSYDDVIEASKWVLTEMKKLKIRRIKRVYEYLEEQIQKQYEKDAFSGKAEYMNIDRLSFARRINRILKKSEPEQNPEKKRVTIERAGRAKKEKTTLMEIRKQLDEIFFDSGRYRLTHDCFCGDDSVAHCHLDLNLIYQSRSDYENLTPETLFDLLHEIGHLEKNTEGMTRREEEYSATEWALERMKMYNFELPRKRQKEFENYINGFRAKNRTMKKKINAENLEWEE